MKKYLLMCCALAVGAIAGPTLAKDVEEYAVRKIEYQNKGAYTVEFIQIRYNVKNSSGKTVTCKMTGDKLKGPGDTRHIQIGQERTFDLRDKSHFKPAPKNSYSCDPSKDGGYIPVGSEVRARIKIKTGDTENCRKENKVKFYYHPKGGTVKYTTKGTTLANNRCQIQSKGGVLWEDVQ